MGERKKEHRLNFDAHHEIAVNCTVSNEQFLGWNLLVFDVTSLPRFHC